MDLTEKERDVINAMRGESNGIDNDTTDREEMIDRYMKMDDTEFIERYAEVVGDDTILAVLQDTLEFDKKWEAIFEAIEVRVIDELFANYVSEETNRELFLQTQDREQLCAQLVDLTID
jgi:hypothetical protein